MKNAIILHGTGDTKDSYWFPYMKEKLEEKGFAVWLPQLPNAGKPSLNDWLPFIVDGGTFGSGTVITGHSAGAQIILSVLEKVQTPIKQAVLVSGYAESLRNTADSDEKPKLNWEQIKKNVQDIIFINSDDDPWGCDDTQGRKLFEKLGGTLIIRHGEGHMGSTTYNQSYKEFPFLAKLV